MSTIRVKIETAEETNWYKSQLESFINVTDWIGDELYYKIKGTDLYILKSDCSIVSEESPTEFKEWESLPERWAILRTEENAERVNKWFSENTNLKCCLNKHYLNYPSDIGYRTTHELQKNYTIITDEQFDRWVLKKRPEIFTKEIHTITSAIMESKELSIKEKKYKVDVVFLKWPYGTVLVKQDTGQYAPEGAKIGDACIGNIERAVLYELVKEVQEPIRDNKMIKLSEAKILAKKCHHMYHSDENLYRDFDEILEEELNKLNQ